MLFTYKEINKIYFRPGGVSSQTRWPLRLAVCRNTGRGNDEGRLHIMSTNYNRGEPRVRGESNQNLGRTLPLVEYNSVNTGCFLKWLENQARFDPDNFLVGNVEVELEYGCKNFPVIVGEHSQKRTFERTFDNPDQILAKATKLLKIPMIGRQVANHPVAWDEELNEATACNEDGFGAVTVLDEQGGIVVVFEAGFEWIRVVTIYGDPRRFKPHAGDFVIHIASSGQVILPPEVEQA